MRDLRANRRNEFLPTRGVRLSHVGPPAAFRTGLMRHWSCDDAVPFGVKRRSQIADNSAYEIVQNLPSIPPAGLTRQHINALTTPNRLVFNRGSQVKSTLYGIGLLGLCAVTFFGGPANADTVFQLSGATLQYGGDLTGTITFNNALTAVTAIDVFAPGPVVAGAYTFAPMTYTDTTGFSVHYQLPLNAYVLDSDSGNGDAFQLTFADITASGSTTFEQNSYEHQTDAGNRVVTGGSLVPLAATPIPAALPLFAGGLGLIGLLARRRKRLAVAALA